MNVWKSMARVLLIGYFAAFLVSCGGDVDTNSSSSFGDTSNTGTLKLYVQTNPVYFLPYEAAIGAVMGFYEVNLSIRQVQVYHQKSKKWIDVPLTTTFKGKSVDFKKFTVTQNQEHLLAENTVPAGHYSQVKIVFDQNQPGQIIKNYVRANNGTANGESHAVNYVAGVADGFIIPASINVAAEGNAWLGLTMDLRSLFAMIDRSYTYKPVAMAVDLSEAGNIEVNVGTNDGSVLVSAQRNGKIIRSLYAPAVTPAEVGKKILLSQLPKTTGPADTYQVVLSSNSTDLKVIINVTVNGGGQTTSLMTSAPIVLVQGLMMAITNNSPKLSNSEVMGVMGMELIQNVRISDAVTLPVVLGYGVSSAGDLSPDFLQRAVSFFFAAAAPQVADYGTLPTAFRAYSNAVDTFDFRSDPDLNSLVFIK